MPGLEDRRIAPADLAKAVLMQQYFCVSNRVAGGLVKLILKEIFRLTNEPVVNKEHEFSVDGSGLPTSIKQNYENDCKAEKAKKGYGKMIAMVGTTYKLFSSVAFTGAPEDNESPYFEPLLSETAACY